MSDKLQRMLEKAKAKRGRKPASDTILIACERPEDVPRRVDVLIAAGKLTEADRARCVFWPDDWEGTHDEWVLMMDRNTTPEDIRRRWPVRRTRPRGRDGDPSWPPTSEKRNRPSPVNSL